MELYFYTHLEKPFHRKRVMDMLEGKLILSDPLRFNDPFDSQLDIFLDADDKNLPIPDTTGMRYRMLCFSERWDSLLMWGHYTCCHKGVCLKLDVDPAALPRKGDILKPIRYSTHHPSIYASDLENGDRDAVDAYLLTKSVDWLYEKEWRYITSYSACRRNAVSEPDYVEADSFVKVKEVYLGVKFNASVSSSNCLLRLYGDRIASDTIFDLLERGESSRLDDLSRSESGKSAVDRERVLMAFRSKMIPVSECGKKAGFFGLERRPFEYNKYTSLNIGCLTGSKIS